MNSKMKRVLLLFIYFFSPALTMLFYYLEGGVISWSDKPAFIINSVLGILAYVFMCFNILFMTKIKVIEENFSLRFLTNFHTIMSSIALFLGAAHGLWLIYLGRFQIITPLSLGQFYTGTIGFIIFIVLMALALFFMTNRLVKSKKIMKFRASAYKKKFRYNLNKVLHNITVLAVFLIFLHTLLSFTALRSTLMRGVYFFFFILTLIGWVSHKVVRRIRVETDPYVHRKGSWDFISELIKESDEQWTLEIIKEIPSLYVCIQCGVCTNNCSVAPVSNGRYNPRLIMQEILRGQRETLETDHQPDIWLCSTCQKCVENCPQKIDITEIFSYVKNECFVKGISTDGFQRQAKMIFEYGSAIAITNPILKRREQLGLSEIKFTDLEEIQLMMKETGLDLSTSEEGMSKE